MKKEKEGTCQFNVVLSADLNDRLNHAAVSIGKKKVELVRVALDALLPKSPGVRLTREDYEANLGVLRYIDLVDELPESEWMYCPYFTVDEKGDERKCLYPRHPFAVCKRCPCNPDRLRSM